ncbi:MAG: ABC transporter permease [Cytophagaceae bacterium]|jgi:ABC-2 type transport system permease protein|nr:ABC transporter permease [Cytophagaceae bacterium]
MIAVRAALQKEFLQLLRDRSGLILLFLMPAILVIIMSLLQDKAMKKLNDDGISILVIDEDRDSLGRAFVEQLQQTQMFDVHSDSLAPNTELSAYMAAKGYLAYVHIPPGSTATVRAGAQLLMNKVMGSFGMPASGDSSAPQAKIIDVELDPTLSKAQSMALESGFEKILLNLQGQIMVSSMMKNGERGPSLTMLKLQTGTRKLTIVPNSVQHNVPAWTIFSMFFIIIPLASSMVNERREGSLFRLKTIQHAIRNIMLAKVVVYMVVGVFQMLLLLLIGFLIIPLFGLPAIQTGEHYHLIILTSICIAFASSSLGLLFGTLAKTHQQATVGGAVTVLFLAAIGGVWVPVYMMPDIMQKISLISPLNWGLEAFHDLFLRGTGFSFILNEIGLLLAFGSLVLLLTIKISQYRNTL